MKIESMAITNVGRVRRNNEDNFFVCGKYKENPETNDLEYHYCAAADEQLFGVCDGMGGIQLGELASLIAVETMSKYALGFDGKVDACVQDANSRICGEITKRGGQPHRYDICRTVGQRRRRPCIQHRRQPHLPAPQRRAHAAER